MSLDKIKVFIVDDHPLFRRGVRDVIEREPRFHIVGEAGDGETALAEIKKLKPAVALVDIQIPKLDGLQLVSALRGCRPPVAVIVLTMHSEESAFNAAMDAGAQGYILKDNATEDLVLGLKTVAGGGVYLSPSIAGTLLKRSVASATGSRAPSGHTTRIGWSRVFECCRQTTRTNAAP